MRTSAVLLAAATLVVGCQDQTKNAAPAPSGSTSASASPPSGSAAGSATTAGSAAPPGSGVVVSIDGKETSFPYAALKIARISLYDKPFQCGDKDDRTVKVDIDTGVTAGTIYTGPVAANAHLTAGALNDERVPTYLTLLDVKPFEMKRGQHAKGTVDFEWKKDGKTYKATGPFDAVICDVPGESTPLPAPAANAPVSGKFGKNPTLTAKSALAFLKHDADDNVDYIDQIKFYPDAVTCDAASKAKTWFHVNRPAGASTRHPVAPVAQPADMYYVHYKNGYLTDGPASGWVKLDKVELKAGGTVSGSVVADDRSPKDPSKASGTFNATVCQTP